MEKLNKLCKVCQSIIEGNKVYCSRSCAAKGSWANASERKLKTSVSATERNKAGLFGVGRPKDSKNKKPYPIGTTRTYSEEQRKRRGERFTAMNLARTDEDYIKLFKNRVVGNYVIGPEFYVGLQRMYDAMSDFFDIERMIAPKYGE